ncbi:hypothetical protein ACSDQ9_07680 [Aestuariimicrobium soli]|uniref:hypothetical protein n=1 Tax=Aestuariimicrobium soli TaxID=2035834 RepID=UPI003EBA7A15
MSADAPSTSGSAVRAVVVPLVVLAAVLALTTAWVWSLREELGDRVAIHWGAKGAPDAWASVTSALIGNGAITAATVAVVMALAVWVRERVALPALASGMATFLGVGTNGLVASQAGNDGQSQLGFELVLGLVAGIVVGVVVAAVLWKLKQREPQPVAGPGPLPPGAPVLDVADDVAIVWRGQTRTGAAMYVVPFLGLLPIAGFLVFAVVTRVWGMAVFMLVLTVVMGLLFVMLRCDVTVDQRGLRATAGRITWLNVPLDQIRSATVDHVEPLGDFGGWGIRFGRRGLGLVTSRGQAVLVTRAEARDACVTVTDPEGCAAAINALVQRRR